MDDSHEVTPVVAWSIILCKIPLRTSSFAKWLTELTRSIV